MYHHCRHHCCHASHLQLSKELPRRSLPTLPARKLIGDNFSPNFLEKRRAGLHAYLFGIVSDPATRTSQSFLNFLDDGRHLLQQMYDQPLSLDTSMTSCSSSSSANVSNVLVQKPSYSNVQEPTTKPSVSNSTDRG